ncbi:MAG: ABC transporter ATP-binding protein [Spirochaetales bacterium]|nr:ABC transporter ATP-binding protein [Spirochaetales bacterium]
MLSIQNLSFSHKHPVFRGISLEIARGDFIHVKGPNGSGKTSLLRLIAGLVPSVYPGTLEGTITFNTESSGKKDALKLALTGPWAASRLFCRTVWEEVSFSPGAIPEKAEELLDYFNLTPFRNVQPHDLSGGQQQLVLLCAYLSTDPDLILLDEIFTQLSSEMKAKLVKLLKLYNKNGKTIIIAEHQLPGKLKEYVSEFYIQNTPPDTTFNLSSSVLYRPSAETTESVCIKNLALQPGKGIRIEYDSLTVTRGRLVHIKGSTGAGKSTLIRTLAGLDSYEGSVRLSGKEISEFTRQELCRKAAVVLQSSEEQFFCPTVEKEIRYSAERLNRLDTDYLHSLIEDLDLLNLLHMNPYNLSQGEKKRCQIAAALALQPEILILDEPDAGVDHYNLNTLYTIFIKLLNIKTTIFFTSHNDFFIKKLFQAIPDARTYSVGEPSNEI